MDLDFLRKQDEYFREHDMPLNEANMAVRRYLLLIDGVISMEEYEASADPVTRRIARDRARRWIAGEMTTEQYVAMEDTTKDVLKSVLGFYGYAVEEK